MGPPWLRRFRVLDCILQWNLSTNAGEFDLLALMFDEAVGRVTYNGPFLNFERSGKIAVVSKDLVQYKGGRKSY